MMGSALLASIQVTPTGAVVVAGSTRRRGEQVMQVLRLRPMPEPVPQLLDAVVIESRIQSEFLPQLRVLQRALW